MNNDYLRQNLPFSGAFGVWQHLPGFLSRWRTPSWRLCAQNVTKSSVNLKFSRSPYVKNNEVTRIYLLWSLNAYFRSETSNLILLSLKRKEKLRQLDANRWRFTHSAAKTASLIAMATARINMQHGFMKSIIKNQVERYPQPSSRFKRWLQTVCQTLN